MIEAETAIRTTIEATVEKLMTMMSENFQKINFSDMVSTTQKEVNLLGAKLIEQMVLMIDGLFDMQRDRHKITLRNVKSRKMLSSMGEITLKRNLYYDKAAKRYFFAVDEMLCIEKHSRIEQNLKQKLIEDATLTSYGKASKLSGGCVSRQTVHNLVASIPHESFELKTETMRVVPQIYIEADEDHIHLNDGRNAEVKLVYVHEGRRKECEGRSELINVKYFALVGSSKDIWSKVNEYLYRQYDVQDSEVYLTGDGAAWIKQGLQYLPYQTVYRLDRFHVYKSITDAFSEDKPLRRMVINSIKCKDADTMVKYYLDYWLIASKGRKKRIMDSRAYLENNFEVIDMSTDNLCSAEGHVSHVLSSRLSSRPMAWSKKGAGQMARLRAFYFNGGDFSTLLTKRKGAKNTTVIQKNQLVQVKK